MAKYVTIIGRAEEIDIVGTALGIPAKVDTGAYRSSIHAGDIKIVEKDGAKQLKFSILGHKNAVIKRDLAVADFTQVNVRSSNGHEQTRYEVKLKVKLANKIFTTSFSLTDRDNNIFPVLIGRTALNRRFIVDVAKSSVKMDKLLSTFGLDEKGFGEEV